MRNALITVLVTGLLGFTGCGSDSTDVAPNGGSSGAGIGGTAGSSTDGAAGAAMGGTGGASGAGTGGTAVGGTGGATNPQRVRECDGAPSAWIWCDDFEVDRSASYFEDDAPLQAGVGIDGSVGARFVYNPGTSGVGGVKVAFGRTPSSYFRPVDAGTQDYREIFWRMMLRNQPGWVGGGGDKLSRATIFADSNWSQAMIAHVWSGGDGSNYLGMDPASGTDTGGNLQTSGYNDFANLRWLGWQVGTTPLFDSSHVGQWYCVEAHVRLNDPGQSNGVFDLWIDGNLETQHNDLNWIGSYNAYGLNAVLFENYWNDSSPVVQERYFDNLVVSTARIGCP
jgi:hypothetical protein